MSLNFMILEKVFSIFFQKKKKEKKIDFIFLDFFFFLYKNYCYTFEYFNILILNLFKLFKKYIIFYIANTYFLLAILIENFYFLFFFV